jgi:hypothetical protein
VNLIDGEVKFVWYESSSGAEIPSGGAVHSLTNFNYSIVPTPIEKAAGTEIRVAFWNVNRRLDQAGAQNSIERILLAIQPDIIGFSEVDDVSASFVAGLLDSWLPLVGGGWQVIKDDYDLIRLEKSKFRKSFVAVFDLIHMDPEIYKLASDKKMLDIYFKYIEGDASELDIEYANNQLTQILKSLGLGVLVALPFSPITIPYLIKKSEELGIDIIPNWYKRL